MVVLFWVLMVGGGFNMGGCGWCWVYFGWLWVVVCLFWLVVGGGGLILGSCGWRWVYFRSLWVAVDLFWVVVGGGGFIFGGGGSWWMVVGGGMFDNNPMQSNFIEITLRDGCSLINLLHMSRTPFPKNNSGRLLL